MGSGAGPKAPDNVPDTPKDKDGKPIYIGTPGKAPEGTADKPVYIGAGDKNPEIDIWCRGVGCGGPKDSTPSNTLTTKEKKDLGDRGEKGVSLVANPEKSKTDFSQREKDNYKIEEKEFYEFDESVQNVGLDRKYGFDLEEGWKTYEVSSKDNKVEPLIKMSVGTAKKDDQEYLAIVAHERFAQKDGNRFKLDEYGDNILDKDGNFVPNPDAATKAVPASQLTYDAAQQSGMLKSDAKPEKVFLISENVINDQAQKALPEAHAALGKNGQPLTLRKDAEGVEGEQFKIIAGLDNNYAYLNTVGRNPDFFGDYELVSIETFETPPTMNMELSKKKKPVEEPPKDV